MEKRKILYITWFISTVTLYQVSSCPFEAVPGDPYRYLIKAAKIKTICAPGTKFSLKSCTCVSAPNDPRLKLKQETRSKFPANDAVVKPNSGLFTSQSVQHSGSNIANRNHVFTSASVSGIGHGTFSGSLSMINTGHVSSFKFPSNQEQRRGGFVTRESFGTPSNTDHLFDFPPNNNAGDRQILPDEPMYPGGKPVHFSKTERRGNQIKHSSFSIHPGAGTTRVSMKAHVSSHHGNNRQSQQSSFSFTDPQSQDFFNWPLPPQRDDRLGFDLFHGSQMDNSLHGNGIHSGVPPPPNRGRSPLDVPPPPPPKSIEHRLYLENENMSPSHIDILRPKPVQVNKSTRKKVSQHTLDMIRAWFTGGHTPLDVHYTDRFVHGKDSTVHNGGKPIDSRYPPNKVSNTDALFNLPDNGAMSQEKPVTRNTDSLFNIPNTASTPHDLPGNTDHLFNLPDAGTTGQHDLSGNTDNLFNLPTGGSGPRDLHGNTGHLFDLSSVSEVSGGSHNLSPKNKIPVNGNTDHLFDIPPFTQGDQLNNKDPLNKIPPIKNKQIEVPFINKPIDTIPKDLSKLPITTDSLFNLPTVNSQNNNIPNNNPLPPIGNHLTGLSRVSQFLDLGNGKTPNQAIPDAKLNSKNPVKNFDSSFSDKIQNQPGVTPDIPSDIPSFFFDPAGESFGLNEVHTVGNANSGKKISAGKIPDLKPDLKQVSGKLDNGFLDTSIYPDEIVDIGSGFNNKHAGESFGLNEVHTIGNANSGHKISTGKIPDLNPVLKQVGGKFDNGFLDTSIYPEMASSLGNGSGIENNVLNLNRPVTGHVNQNEFIPVESATRKTNSHGLNGQIRSGSDKNLELNSHIPDPFINPNEFISSGNLNSQSGSHPLEQNGPLPRHVNPNEFLPVNGVIGSTNDKHSAQNGGEHFSNFGNDEDVINLLNEVDIDTLLEAIGGIPLHEIDTQALRMFQKKVNQLISFPKEEPTLKNLIKSKKLTAAPFRSKHKTIELGKAKASLTLSAQEIKELHQKLQREIDRITRQEAAEKKKTQLLAKLKAKNQIQKQERKKARKERQEKNRLAKQQAKAERLARQKQAKMERQAKQQRDMLERKAQKQKAKQERQALRAQAKLQKKVRQEEKRKQRQQKRQQQKRMKAVA